VIMSSAAPIKGLRLFSTSILDLAQASENNLTFLAQHRSTTLPSTK